MLTSRIGSCVTGFHWLGAGRERPRASTLVAGGAPSTSLARPPPRTFKPEGATTAARVPGRPLRARAARRRAAGVRLPRGRTAGGRRRRRGDGHGAVAAPRRGPAAPTRRPPGGDPLGRGGRPRGGGSPRRLAAVPRSAVAARAGGVVRGGVAGDPQPRRRRRAHPDRGGGPLAGVGPAAVRRGDHRRRPRGQPPAARRRPRRHDAGRRRPGGRSSRPRAHGGDLPGGRPLSSRPGPRLSSPGGRRPSTRRP